MKIRLQILFCLRANVTPNFYKGGEMCFKARREPGLSERACVDGTFSAANFHLIVHLNIFNKTPIFACVKIWD